MNFADLCRAQGVRVVRAYSRGERKIVYRVQRRRFFGWTTDRTFREEVNAREHAKAWAASLASPTEVVFP